MLALLFATAFAAPEIPPSVEAWVKELIDSKRTPGVAVAIWENGDAVRATWGTTTPGGPPLPLDAVYDYGSITKTFSAALVADAALRGELSWDDGLVRHLPEGVTAPDGITLRMLASHTSGLPRMPADFTVDTPGVYDGWDPKRLWSALGVAKLASSPGTTYAYSNFGAAVLGQALAHRTGRPWGELLADRLIVPLGLADHAGWPASPALKARMLTPHTGSVPTTPWTFDAFAPAGAVVGDLDGLLRWGILSGGFETTALSPALASLLQPQANVSDTVAVGLGWHRYQGPAGSAWWHNGQTGGFHSFVGFDPASKRVVAVLTPSDVDIDPIGRHLLAGATLPKLRATIPVTGERLGSFVGRYRLGDGTVVTIEGQAGMLTVQLTGQPKLGLIATSDATFQQEAVGATITFTKEKRGIARELQLQQAGRTLKAKRLPDPR